MIDMAKEDGATCLLGGHALTGVGYGQGQFIALTIFTDVTNDMRIAQQEVFGPVLSVIKFKDRQLESRCIPRRGQPEESLRGALVAHRVRDGRGI